MISLEVGHTWMELCVGHDTGLQNITPGGIYCSFYPVLWHCSWICEGLRERVCLSHDILSVIVVEEDTKMSFSWLIWVWIPEASQHHLPTSNWWILQKLMSMENPDFISWWGRCLSVQRVLNYYKVVFSSEVWSFNVSSAKLQFVVDVILMSYTHLKVNSKTLSFDSIYKKVAPKRL